MQKMTSPPPNFFPLASFIGNNNITNDLLVSFLCFAFYQRKIKKRMEYFFFSENYDPAKLQNVTPSGISCHFKLRFCCCFFAITYFVTLISNIYDTVLERDNCRLRWRKQPLLSTKRTYFSSDLRGWALVYLSPA